MRVAFIAPFGMQPKGTVSSRMLPLARALAVRGHAVHIVVPPWDDLSAKPGTRMDTGDEPAGEVTITTLPVPEHGPRAIPLTSGLVRAALRGPWGHPGEQPDVVHVFKPVGYSGLTGLALSLRGVPWVLDNDDWEGPGGWADVNRYSPAQRLSITLMEAWLPRLARAVTAASRTLEARAWDFGLPRSRVFYLPNGVSKDKYGGSGDSESRIVNFELRTGPGILYLKSEIRNWHSEIRNSQSAIRNIPTILLYTRFAEFPWEWVLPVFQRVRERQPNTRLLVVGGGFFGEEERLEAEARRLGYGDEVVAVTGMVEERDLPSLLWWGDVALYPMRDNLINRAKSPVKLLEQMVMGLPIVAHDVGQVPHFLGDAGVLVPPGDVQGMADAAAALLADPERRTRLGEMARQRVWAEFDWRRLSETAERAYMLALEVGRARRRAG
jgi:glycosyltransferase involved in cell wall biosynthesis